MLSALKKLVVLEKDGKAIQLVLKGNVYLDERTIIYDLTEVETAVVERRGRRAGRKSEN